MPGVLVELGFLSNLNDWYLLAKTHQQKVSKVIANSLVNILINHFNIIKFTTIIVTMI